ncbi:hypothetical protein SKAU_G00189530 [Synaphobranchus kaupii]|uniref:Ig-like domain-containing protein n=1 Tax=Synaphobranchus kaupii TaxID=118154 RepID=A0A9Q1FDD8_SYNKA|nr:hypothetical protein SKAU_G00189530 [Synaphobranchus kaupii]
MISTVPLTVLMLALSGLEAVVILTQEKYLSVSPGSNLNILSRASSPPTLNLLPPSPLELSEGRATLVCLARGFYPDSVTVSWTEDGRTVAGSEAQTSEARRQPDGTYSASSLLMLTAARWSSGRSFSCQLSHSALRAPLSQELTPEKCGSHG